MPPNTPPDVAILIASCWAQDSDSRPGFKEIVAQLQTHQKSASKYYWFLGVLIIYNSDDGDDDAWSIFYLFIYLLLSVTTTTHWPEFVLSEILFS